MLRSLRARGACGRRWKEDLSRERHHQQDDPLFRALQSRLAERHAKASEPGRLSGCAGAHEQT